MLNSRQEQALNLRQDGLTYKAIGERLGVCSQRARDIVKRAERCLRIWPNNDLMALSARARNCLLCYDYDTREKVLQGVLSGDIRPCAGYQNGLANYGKKTHKEVCDWLGIELVQPDKTKPYPHESIRKAIAFLERHGYVVTASPATSARNAKPVDAT